MLVTPGSERVNLFRRSNFSILLIKRSINVEIKHKTYMHTCTTDCLKNKLSD